MGPIPEQTSVSLMALCCAGVVKAPLADSFLIPQDTMSTRIPAGLSSRIAAAEAAAILAAYDFSAAASLADIGGGEGALIASLLRRRPQLRALVFDLDSAIADQADGSGAALSAAGAFFAGIPANYDLYLLKDVIRRWNDRDAIHILRNCRAAMGDASRLLVIEELVPGDLATPSGPLPQARSAYDHRRLLEASGLALIAIVPTSCRLSLIEAVPHA